MKKKKKNSAQDASSSKTSIFAKREEAHAAHAQRENAHER